MQNSYSNYSNESVSRTSCEILDDLSQLKSVITKNYQVTLLQPALRVSNGKTALPLHHLKEQFLEHTGQRGLHKIRVFDSFRDT